YLVWPVVILGLLWWLRRRASGGGQAVPGGGVVVPGRRQLAAGLLAVIVAPSLVFSVGFTLVRPSEAFFITPTRLWELGVGALVALGAGVVARRAPSWGAVLAWAGVVAGVASGFVFDAGAAWPGYPAVLPVGGTAAAVAGGLTASSWAPAPVLGAV